MTLSVFDIANSSTVSSPECHDVRHYRTVLGIVQSCIATITLCVWVVLHLDVPKGPDEMTRLARVVYMIFALLSPELVLTMACGEWITCAGFLKRMANEHPTCKWSETHAMFAYMGGFRFINEDGSKEHPREKEFFQRVLDGEIETPDIAVEVILDKSKSDGLAKAIVIIQTLWFALQAINRFVQHLPVTELEITTLAHVTICVFTYWCWWNKPMDVMCPIDIYPRNKESHTEERSPRSLTDNNVNVAQSGGADGLLLGNSNADMVQQDEEVEGPGEADRCLLGDSSIHIAQQNEDVERSGGADGYHLSDSNVDMAQQDEEVEISGGADGHLLDHSNVDMTQQGEGVEVSGGADGHLLDHSNVDMAQQDEEVEISGGADRHLLAYNNVDMAQQSEEVEISGGADGHLLGDSNIDMAQQSEGVEGSGGADGHLLGDEKAQAVRPQLPLRIRTGALFANADGHYMGSRAGHVLAILSGIFGGIHCLAWNSTFHTQLESTLWRVSALLVATLPFMLFSGGALTEAYHIKISSLTGKGRTLATIGSMVKVLRNTTLFLGLISYVFARICLLVLAVLALKTLPEKALLVPSWARYIPHI